jgi:dsDNA-binding SOS-regulon protein
MFNWDMLLQNKERESRIHYTQKNLQENMQKTIELMNNITEGLQRLTESYKEDKTSNMLYFTGNNEALESIRNRLDKLEIKTKVKESEPF